MVQTTDTAAPSYAAIAADFANSCRRSRAWELTAKAIIPGVTSTDPCAVDVVAANDWQKMNVIVINYVDALGKLAGSAQSSSNEYGFDKLANSLTESKILTQSQASGIQQLFATVVQDIFSKQRSDAISQYAPQAKDALNNIIDRLEYVADTDYRGILSIEELNINQFYKDNIKLVRPGFSSLRTLYYRRQWQSDLNELDNKRAAINAYKSSLEALRSAHNSLVDEATKQNPNVGSIVDAYAAQFLPEIQTILQAFSNK